MSEVADLAYWLIEVEARNSPPTRQLIVAVAVHALAVARHDRPSAPMDIANVAMLASYAMAKGQTNSGTKLEVLQGTLDLMVLQTLDSMGPQHGYGIARRIEQVSDDILKLNEGTVYAALMRLQHRRWIGASWGASENNRKAKFYAITAAGRRQLAREVETWERLSSLIARLRGAEQG